jgi:hypothetical protein
VSQGRQSAFRVESEVDVFAVLGLLAEHEVDFVVIGAVAVARHGFVRATKDVDIVPSPALENLAKLFRALQALQAAPLELQDFRREEPPLELSVEGLAFGGNWALATKHGRLDVMQYIEGALESAEDYARLRGEAVASRFDFGTVHFAGYEELLDLKLLAGRDADLTDVRALREARGETGPEAGGPPR